MQPQVKVTADNLADFLGVRKYSYGRAEAQNQVGQVVGLAWTKWAAILLTIEAAIMTGKGTITRTGSLGDVMERIGRGCSHGGAQSCAPFGHCRRLAGKRDIHIHVPTVPPQRWPQRWCGHDHRFGVCLDGIPVRADVAMTGEITLRGEVTAIGGLKEKLLAALRGGIKTVLIPEENVKDLQEIPENVKNGLEIVPVKWVDKCWKSRWSACPRRCQTRKRCLHQRPRRRQPSRPSHKR